MIKYLFLVFIITNSINSFDVVHEDLTLQTYIWQGFSHKWEREILFFKTPHRMGSFANKITNEKFKSTNSSSAEFDFTFTPGVNGDFAFPSSNFSIIYSRDNQNDITKFSKTKVYFNLTDEATGNPFPVANNTFSQNISIPTHHFLLLNSVINGFDIKMKCVDDNCNSDGIWPTKFLIDISKCFYENEIYLCQLDFVLNRGWTPSKGSGKAFNYKMFYQVEIDILNIHSYYNYVQTADDSILVNSDIHKGRTSMIREVTLFNEMRSLVTGITAFGFELKKYKNYEALGRYLSAFEFTVGNNEAYEDYNLSKYNLGLNINSSKLTTYFCETELTLKTKTMSFFYDKKIKNNIKAAGKICKNDLSTLLLCSMRGLDNTTKDSITLDSSLFE